MTHDMAVMYNKIVYAMCLQCVHAYKQNWFMWWYCYQVYCYLPLPVGNSVAEVLQKSLFNVIDLFFFKIFRTPMKLLRPSKRCHCVVHNVSWKMSSKRRNVFHSGISTVVLVDALKLNNGTPHKDVGQRNPPTFCFNCWKTLNQMPNTKAWTSTDWSLTIFWWVNS